VKRETVETILKQYFGDKKTAQKFAAAMRQGLKQKRVKK
jgi:hypothetical protein